MNFCKEEGAPCIFAQASGHCCSTACLRRIEKQWNESRQLELTTQLNEVPNDDYFEVLKRVLLWGNHKHGRWINKKSTDWAGGGATLCSCCDYGYSWGEFFEVENFNYCPNCGADMRGGQE